MLSAPAALGCLRPQQARFGTDIADFIYFGWLLIPLPCEFHTLQAPHEALSALAALGCIRPKSAQHGGGFVGHFAAACRGKLLDGSGAAAAPVATAWALAIMQVILVQRILGHSGFRV